MKNKGLMGIGTLIIFIGVILVAAVAAMVLISTSGSLQQRALNTGRETETGVATGLEVFEVSGTDGTDGGINKLDMFARLQAGSDDMKLNNSLITISTKNSTQHLNYGGTQTTASTTIFNVTYLQNGSNNKLHYISKGDVLKFSVQSNREIKEAETISLKFVPRVGATSEVQITTPDTMITNRIPLYP